MRAEAPRADTDIAHRLSLPALLPVHREFDALSNNESASPPPPARPACRAACWGHGTREAVRMPWLAWFVLCWILHWNLYGPPACPACLPAMTRSLAHARARAHTHTAASYPFCLRVPTRSCARVRLRMPVCARARTHTHTHKSGRFDSSCSIVAICNVLGSQTEGGRRHGPR